MRKILFLCLMTLISVVTWAADFEYEGLNYNIVSATDLTVVTTYSGEKGTTASTYTGDYTIPETVPYNGETYTVIGIGKYTFNSATGLGKVVLPETITYLESYVFYKTDIQEITIPDNVTKIDTYAFQKSEALKSVVLGSSLESLGNYCFDGCTALTSITSKNTTPPTVYYYTFTSVPTTCVVYVPSQSVGLYQSASYWKNFTIEGTGYSFSVTTADATDIAGTSATLNGVISAGDETLLSCGFEYWEDESDVKTVDAETIDDVNIGTTVTGLSKSTTYTFRAFAITENGTTYGDELTFRTRAYNFMVDDIYYNIPGDSNEVEVIYGGTRALATSSYTGEMTIPEMVTYDGVQYKVVGIGDVGFYRCTLKAITLPTSITYIGEQAFRDCSSLTKVEFLGEGLYVINAQAFQSCSALTSITLPSSLTTLGERCFESCAALTNINVPGKVSTISERAFYNCKALEEVSLEEGIDSIGYRAFYYCESLKEVTIPSSVTKLGDNVFEDCLSMTQVSLSEGLVSIGEYTFYVCTKLKKFALPNSIERIGEGAFWSCAFSNITIPEKITRIEDHTFQGCTKLTEINLPDGLTYIGDRAFEACQSLPTITIPESVTYLGEMAFNGCTSLYEITIPGSIPSIKNQTFFQCSNLKKIVLNEGVSTIESNAFYWCTGMETISLPESLTSIGTGGFEYCTALKEITIPSQITTISSRTFQQCGSLTKVTLPEGLISLGYRAFYWCENLPAITIPNSVTEIGESAFNGCYKLAEVTLGSSLNYLDKSCFAYCYPLSEVIVLAQTPPSLYDSSVFSNVTISSCNLYVPATVVNDYSSASIWQEFNIQAIIPPSLETLEATQVTETSAIINGTVVMGTLPILEQGFEYWDDDANFCATIVDLTADGAISMTLDNLTSNTTYTYRTYCVTMGGMEYGEEQTFTTETPTGINGVSSAEDVQIRDIYSTSGQKLNTTVKGVNIIQYNDGTTKKLFVK